jgi:hypothetical protein
MMDARAHGASEGQLATYGWLERNDTRAIIDALRSKDIHTSAYPLLLPEPYRGELPPVLVAPCDSHIFALGESMGAGIALQSAAVDPRIEGVVAVASFANLREATYDYAGLRRFPLLRKMLFAPFSSMLLYRGEKLTGLPVAEVTLAATRDVFTPPPAALNKSGRSPAHSTPPPSASNPPSSSAASSSFSLTLRTRSPSNNSLAQTLSNVRFLRCQRCGTGILACQLFTI